MMRHVLGLTHLLARSAQIGFRIAGCVQHEELLAAQMLTPVGGIAYLSWALSFSSDPDFTSALSILQA